MFFSLYASKEKDSEFWLHDFAKHVSSDPYVLCFQREYNLHVCIAWYYLLPDLFELGGVSVVKPGQ
jgi:hypothetical protein